MRIKSFACLALLIIVLMAIGCGHRVGNDPLGVTGGGSNGYGSLGEWSEPVIIDYLAGSWRHDNSNSGYEILNFGQNGIANLSFYNVTGNLQFSESSIFQLSDNVISLNFSGTQVESYNYSVSNNTLILSQGDAATTYQKVE